MRINRIEMRHIKMHLVAPFETSFGVETDEEHIIVQVNTEGVTGWGESPVGVAPFYSYETTQTAWHVLRDFLIPAVLGKDIVSVGDAISLCERVRGHNMAKAGLESALWDAFAKAHGVSLAHELGGTRERIQVGVSVGIQASPKALVERVSPRIFRVVALPAPTEREKTQMYVQRYIPHLPAGGEIVIFDRSWYNRAGVERVMGFCTDETAKRFLEVVPGMEKSIVDSGVVLLKYWLEVCSYDDCRVV